MPLNANASIKNDISMYLESYNKDNLDKCLNVAESISNVTKLPIVYSDSFSLELELSNKSAAGANRYKYIYIVFKVFLIVLFLIYTFREKLI